MRRKTTARNTPLTIDLKEVLGEPKTKEPASTTSVRLPISMAKKLTEIAKAERMSRTKLIRSLIAALIRDYEEQHGTKHR